MIDRIHERAVFREFGRGAVRSRSGPLTVVRASPTGRARPALAFAISRKVGNAVVRNRLRRQIRHAAVQLEQANVFESAPYLVIVHPPAVGCSMKELSSYLQDALSKQASIGISDFRTEPDRFER
ncbi:MAG: ribonuclease P protein component [Actinobacteria bacterium]|nr:ribonuclease P protein component [Actinomycetota bacterium]MSV85376.1 ribonuclease P protein component [Actinomycetota bacterium]